MNIAEVASSIQETGTEVTYLIVGEPGIGKSSVLQELKRTAEYANHEFIYVDCPVMDVPDVQLPYVENGVSKFATNALWGVENSAPKVIMLDELAKSNSTTRLLFTRLLLEHQIGAYKLPTGSVVFATGNQTKDGVGDTYPAHMMNRVSVVHMEKPSAEEWCNWASTQGIDPVVMAWVTQFPHALAEAEEDNPYIFNPKTNATSFVSPRSLVKASAIVTKRAKLSAKVLHEGLRGTIGASAATDMAAYIQLANQLPTWKAVINDPTGTSIPTNASAQLIMAYGALQTLTVHDTKPEVDAVITYMSRFPLEVGAVAFSSLARNAPMSVKRNVLANPIVTKWITENAMFLAG